MTELTYILTTSKLCAGAFLVAFMNLKVLCEKLMAKLNS